MISFLQLQHQFKESAHDIIYSFSANLNVLETAVEHNKTATDRKQGQGKLHFPGKGVAG